MPELFKFLEHLKPHIPPGGIPVSGNEEVWLLDNTAYRSSPSEPWTAEFITAFFHHSGPHREKVAAAVVALMHHLGIAKGDKETEDRVHERIAPFIASVAFNRTVDVIYEPNAEGGGQLHLGPSDGNGLSIQTFTLPIIDAKTKREPTAAVGSVPFKVLKGKDESGDSQTITFETGTTYLAEDGGWGVFSDLDDTVKVSCVNNHDLLLKNTFVNVPEHSHGLPEMYQALQSALSTPEQPVPFIYISASPYNLYPFLRKFLVNSAYPKGSIQLRDMSWMDIHNWFSIHGDSFFHAEPVQKYKDERFVRFSTSFPRFY
jgi:hypothetical protein